MEISMASTDSVKVLVVGDSGNCLLLTVIIYYKCLNPMTKYCVIIKNKIYYLLFTVIIITPVFFFYELLCMIEMYRT